MKLHIAKRAREHLFLFHQHDGSALEHLYSPPFSTFWAWRVLEPPFL